MQPDLSESASAPRHDSHGFGVPGRNGKYVPAEYLWSGTAHQLTGCVEQRVAGFRQDGKDLRVMGIDLNRPPWGAS